MKLQDKVIVITGGAGGIGKATAMVCAGYGGKVIVSDLKQDACDKAAAEIVAKGGEAIGVAADVTDRSAVKAAVEKIMAKYGKIDVLFNNAGGIAEACVHEMTEQQYDFVMDINCKGAFNWAHEVANVMIPKKKGRIITTSSITGSVAEYSIPTYGMSKAALRLLTQNLALELGQYGITAVSVSPGHIDTSLLRNTFYRRAEEQNKDPQEFFDALEATIPLGRLGQPEEIGELIAFLCDDRSAYIDGCNIIISGGKIMW
ncbi:MAG: SDR family NAD(P)-dependent oxidoreductase [Christensenellales bacterium]|jgi:NAD(P)-dependent dehydrogenase (short-subunit alcohol dehydrogenase family)